MIRALPEGHPDIAGVMLGGKAVYIEVKSATGKVSPAQERFHAMLRGLGALVIVARSVEDVEKWLG